MKGPEANPLGLEPAGLLRLMSWLSPAFPVGGFSYSHGIEAAVEAGLLRNRADTQDWIAHILSHGAGWIDAGLFLRAHRAVTQGDEAGLAEVVCWGQALRGTAELALEASAQGRAFLSAVQASWPDAAWARWAPLLLPKEAEKSGAASYAIAVAVACALADIPEGAGLLALLQALTANLVSAAVRLVPLGQTDGQKITATLAASLPALVSRARHLSPQDFGAAAPMVDWTSMAHEIQYTRLFRS